MTPQLGGVLEAKGLEPQEKHEGANGVILRILAVPKVSCLPEDREGTRTASRTVK